MEGLGARLEAGMSSGQEVMGGQGVVLSDMPEGRLTQPSH